MPCTLTQPDEYDWTTVRRRCDLMSYYFDHLLLIKNSLKFLSSFSSFCAYVHVFSVYIGQVRYSKLDDNDDNDDDFAERCCLKLTRKYNLSSIWGLMAVRNDKVLDNYVHNALFICQLSEQNEALLPCSEHISWNLQPTRLVASCHRSSATALCGSTRWSTARNGTRMSPGGLHGMGMIEIPRIHRKMAILRHYRRNGSTLQVFFSGGIHC